jgi:hypothetical protein
VFGLTKCSDYGKDGALGGTDRENRRSVSMLALSPLFWTHGNLYGTIQIDMGIHLDLGLAA